MTGARSRFDFVGVSTLVFLTALAAYRCATSCSDVRPFFWVRQCRVPVGVLALTAAAMMFMRSTISNRRPSALSRCPMRSAWLFRSASTWLPHPRHADAGGGADGRGHARLRRCAARPGLQTDPGGVQRSPAPCAVAFMGGPTSASRRWPFNEWCCSARPLLSPPGLLALRLDRKLAGLKVRTAPGFSPARRLPAARWKLMNSRPMAAIPAADTSGRRPKFSRPAARRRRSARSGRARCRPATISPSSRKGTAPAAGSPDRRTG